MSVDIQQGEGRGKGREREERNKEKSGRGKREEGWWERKEEEKREGRGCTSATPLHSLLVFCGLLL